MRRDEARLVPTPSDEPSGLPSRVEENTSQGSPLDVVTGREGIGVIVHTYGTTHVSQCTVRFMLLDYDLRTLVEPPADQSLENSPKRVRRLRWRALLQPQPAK